MHHVPRRAQRANRVASLLLAAGLAGLACASSGIEIDFAPPQAEGATAWPIEVTDGRAFSVDSNRTTEPTTERRPVDPDWTRRVFGRQNLGEEELGADQFTAEGQSVPGLVRLALQAGLARAGLRPPATSGGDGALEAVVEKLWIWEPEFSATAHLIYRAEVRLQGDAPHFERGLDLVADGSVSGGAIDDGLWARAMRALLEKLEQVTYEAASGSATPMVE